jgi:cytochrome c55X
LNPRSPVSRTRVFLIQVKTGRRSIAHLFLMSRAAVFWFGWALACAAGGAAAQPLAPGREAELVRLVRQDCGSCHGLTLRGGLGPALSAAALAGRSPESLKLVILYGRPGTPMPPWSAFLTEQEAQWIAARLLAGFPEVHAGRRNGQDETER